MPSDVKPQGTETVGAPQMLNGLVSRDSSAKAGSGLPLISTLDWPILGRSDRAAWRQQDVEAFEGSGDVRIEYGPRPLRLDVVGGGRQDSGLQPAPDILAYVVGPGAQVVQVHLRRLGDEDRTGDGQRVLQDRNRGLFHGGPRPSRALAAASTAARTSAAMTS